jgi:hypothetical protein
MVHDDTLARLQYISPPDDEGTDATAPVESRRDRQTFEPGMHEKPANGASPADETSSSASRPANAVDDQPAANQPRLDDSAPDILSAASTDQERTTDEVSTGGSTPLDNNDAAPGFDSTSEHVADIEEAAEPGHEFVQDATPKEMDQYRRIREADDLDALAETSGMPRRVIDEAKQHLFQRQHDVAVGPGEIKHGYFTPAAVYGDLWERVASGIDVTDENRVQFWSLLAHEYVESKLMEAGLPYLSSEPGAWRSEDMRPEVLAAYPSAHNTAPLSTQSQVKDLLRHWGKLGLEKDDLRVAPDLSNLDDVVRAAKEGLGL